MRRSHIHVFVAGSVASDPLSVRHVSVPSVASLSLSSLPCHSQHGQYPGMHIKFCVK